MTQVDNTPGSLPEEGEDREAACRRQAETRRGHDRFHVGDGERAFRREPQEGRRRQRLRRGDRMMFSRGYAPRRVGGRGLSSPRSKQFELHSRQLRQAAPWVLPTPYFRGRILQLRVMPKTLTELSLCLVWAAHCGHLLCSGS
jgi:hypothetical protein